MGVKIDVSEVIASILVRFRSPETPEIQPQLDSILGIKRGDTYDLERLETSLWIRKEWLSSLYQDDGYLTFQAMPIETHSKMTPSIEVHAVNEQFRIGK